MAQSVQLPDGSWFPLKEGEDPREALSVAAQLYPDAFGRKKEEKPKEDTKGFKAAAAAGFERMKGETALTAGKLGLMDTAEAEKYQKEKEEAAKSRFTPTEEGWTEAPWQKFKETLGGSVPYMAAPAAAGLAALAAPVAAPTAAALGAAGAFGVSTGQFVGTNLARQMDTGKTLDQTSGLAALGAAIPQAAFDTAAMALMPGVGKLFGSVGEKLTIDQLRAITTQTLGQAVKDYAVKTGAAVGREGFTETVQQVLERLQAGLSLTDPEARKEYIDSFIGGAALAGAGAPLGRYTERSAAQKEVDKADKEAKKAAAQAAAEQLQLAAEKEEARKQTPDYALEVLQNNERLLAEAKELEAQRRNIVKGSETEYADAEHNKALYAQLAANKKERKELGPELLRLEKSGLLAQAQEQKRVAGLTPEEYALEGAQEVNTQPAKTAEPDLEGYYEQQVHNPNEERRKADAAEQTRVAELPAAYATERMELARTHLIEPTGADYVSYLLQDPYKAALVVETRTPLPGMTANESRLIRNDVAKQLKALGTQELTARQTDLQNQQTGAPAANPMATFMDQSEALDTDRRQGVTDADIAFTEKQAAMPRGAVAQGELFGEQRVGQAAGVTDTRQIGQQLAELQKRLEIAYAQRNVDQGGQYRETIRDLTEQIRDLKNRAELPTTGGLGEATADLQERLGRFPESLEAKRAAEEARQAALTKVANREEGAQDAAVASVVDEIRSARPDLRPETLTSIEQAVRDELGMLERYGASPDTLAYTNARLDAISQKWRSGTERGTTFTKTATPTATSEDMLREQMDRAFAQNDQSTRTERRERYAPQDMALLNQIADNFKAFASDPERRNMAGEWLNRVTTTGRANPEMTSDLRNELARLEEGKLQENGQLELPERFMPKEIEGKAPEKKSTAFATAAEFQKYLASDALKAVRQAMGLGKDTASRMHARLAVFQKRIDGLTKQLAALEERKKFLQTQRGIESNTAKDLLNTAEANLKKVYERLDAELLELQTEYMQARQQFDVTAQTVADISQKVADNIAEFQSTDTEAVAAAQKTADAKSAYATAIEQPVTKRNFSALRTARREIITALEQQIAASRKAESDAAILKFLNADLNLQLQLQTEEKALDRDAKALLNAGLALEEAAATQKRSRKNQKEIKQAQQELAAAVDIKGAVDKEAADLDTQIAEVETNIADAEKQLSSAQARVSGQAPKAKDAFGAALESVKTEPLSKAERDAKMAEDKAKLEAFQKSTAALAALPGERIDFSQRQEMLELLRVSNKDSDRIDASIKEIEKGIEEMQIQVAVAEEQLADEQSPDRVAALNKRVKDGNERVAALQASLGNYEKAKARKLVQENRARVLLSGDPEVTQDIDKRIDKLTANIQNQEELAKQAFNPKTGKPLPAETVKDRAKTLARYKRELQVLRGVRSNRLGIKRVDVATGQTVGKARKPRAGAAEQEQMDAEMERVQAYGTAKDKLSAMEVQLAAMKAAKEPRGKAKKEERAEKIRDLQEKVNKQQAEVDRLAPRETGKVSQATRVQSAAPGKFRAGTAETKADTGVNKRPVVEKREVALPTATQAVEDANAFAERLTAAKTDAQRTKLVLEQDETTRVQIEDALYDRVQDLKNRVLKLEEERRTLTGAKGMPAVTRLKNINRELTGEKQEVGDIETNGLYYYLRVAEKNLADFEATLAEVEAKERAEAEAKEDAERAEYGAYITELGSFEGGSEISGFDMGVVDDGGFDFDARYRVSKTAGPSMSTAQVQKAYDALTGQWVNKPETVVVADESGLPVRIRNQAERDGMTGKIPGLYDPKSGKVYLVASNLRSVNDVILTTVHEIAGHFGLQSVLGDTYAQTMTDIYNGNAAIRKAADAKMKQISSLSQNTAVEEALAEQAELDPNAPDTRSAMRKIYDALKKWLRNTVGLRDTFTDAQVNQIIANARNFVIEGGAAGEGKAGVSDVAYRSKEPNAMEELSRSIVAQPRTIKQKLGNNLALQAEMQGVDMRAGIREALKAGADAMGDDSKFKQAMYNVLKADQKMPISYTVMSMGPLELYKDAKGFYGVRSTNKNSAKDVFEAIADMPGTDAQAKVDVATTYMIAQRAANKGLSKLDLGELGVTEEKLAAAMAAVKADPVLEKSLEAVRRAYNAYNKGQISFLAATGAIPKQVAEKLLADGDYVPYYRVRDNGMAELNFGNNTMVTIGDIRRQPYLASLKGGETKILPLNESLSLNTFLLTDMALTNMATKNVAYALQAMGKAMGVMKIQKGNGPADPSVIRFKQEPDPHDSKDTGERWLKVDTKGTAAEGVPSELLVQSLEGSHLALPEFLKLGGVAADLLRTGVTRTPLYIARQLLRDPMAAAFTGGLNYNAFTAVLKAGKEFVRMNTGTSTAQAKLLEKGLIQSGIFAGDTSDMKKMALQLASGRDQNVFEKVFAAADRYAMRADATTRALVYENAEANGLSEVEADMMTMESMNFYKRGLSPTLQYANRLIPFFNAQIQGLNVLYKAATGKMPFEEQQAIKRKFFNNAMLLMATGIVYALAMEDDDAYKNARPRDRYTNFFLPIPGSDEPLKLPIPFEAGYFYSLAVAAVDGMRSEVRGKEQWQALRDMFLGAIPGYSSMGVPQIVKPAFEVWTNKNFLNGGDIESRRFQGLAPEERYNANTTEMAKALSKALPLLSPIQIEHLVRGYLGVLPLAAAGAANGLFAREGKGEAPESRLSELPVVGSAFQKKYGGGDTDVVYQLAHDAMEAKTTLNKIISEGRREDAAAYRAEHKVELASSSAAGSYRQLVGRINTDLRRTQERSDLTAAEKRARIDGLEKAKNDAAQRFIQTVKRLEEQ